MSDRGNELGLILKIGQVGQNSSDFRDLLPVLFSRKTFRKNRKWCPQCPKPNLFPGNPGNLSVISGIFFLCN